MNHEQTLIAIEAEIENLKQIRGDQEALACDDDTCYCGHLDQAMDELRDFAKLVIDDAKSRKELLEDAIGDPDMERATLDGYILDIEKLESAIETGENMEKDASTECMQDTH